MKERQIDSTRQGPIPSIPLAGLGPDFSEVRAFFCLEQEEYVCRPSCCAGRVDCISRSIFVGLVCDGHLSGRLRSPGSGRQEVALLVFPDEPAIIRPPVVQEKEGSPLDQGDGIAAARGTSLSRADDAPARFEQDIPPNDGSGQSGNYCRFFQNLSSEIDRGSVTILCEVRSQGRRN